MGDSPNSGTCMCTVLLTQLWRILARAGIESEVNDAPEASERKAVYRGNIIGKNGKMIPGLEVAVFNDGGYQNRQAKTLEALNQVFSDPKVAKAGEYEFDKACRIVFRPVTEAQTAEDIASNF